LGVFFFLIHPSRISLQLAKLPSTYTAIIWFFGEEHQRLCTPNLNFYGLSVGLPACLGFSCLDYSWRMWDGTGRAARDAAGWLKHGMENKTQYKK